MEEDYNKVVVGDRIYDTSENTPFVTAEGIPIANNPATLESQPYVGYSAPPPNQLPPNYDYGPEPGEFCATIGCFFSWIPIIGILNFLLNTDAPPQSKRQWLANMSCFIAGSILFINFVFWISWTTTRHSSDDD